MVNWEFVLTFVVPVTALVFGWLVLFQVYQLDPENNLYREGLFILGFLFLFFWFQTPSPLLRFLKSRFPPSILTHSISLYVLFFLDRMVNGLQSKDRQPYSGKLWQGYLVLTQLGMLITYPFINFSQTKVTVNAAIMGDNWALVYLFIFITYTILGIGRFVLLGRRVFQDFPERFRKYGFLTATLGGVLIVAVGIMVLVFLSLWALTTSEFGQDFYGIVVRTSLAIALTLVGIGIGVSTNLPGKGFAYLRGIILYLQLRSFILKIWNVFPETQLFEMRVWNDLLNFRKFDRTLYRFFVEISDARLKILSYVEQSFIDKIVSEVKGNRTEETLNIDEVVEVEARIFQMGFYNQRSGVVFERRASFPSVLDSLNYTEQLAYFSRVSRKLSELI